MGIIKPFMGGGFPWNEVTTCTKCGRWADSKSGLCEGHKKGWTTRKIISNERKERNAMVRAMKVMVNDNRRKLGKVE